MKPSFLPIALCVASAVAQTASATDLRTSQIMTHPSIGPEAPVQDAFARMVHLDGGVFVNVESSGLMPGHVHTLWFVAIANPAACATVPCSGKDVLKNSDGVQADAGFAGGVIASDDGTVRFTHVQAEGALINGWFGRGLADTRNSEIHLVLKDHGPVIESRLGDMLTTFRDACTTESINPAFPAVAFADGEPGPNTCALVQYAAFSANEIAYAIED